MRSAVAPHENSGDTHPSRADELLDATDRRTAHGRSLPRGRRCRAGRPALHRRPRLPGSSPPCSPRPARRPTSPRATGNRSPRRATGRRAPAAWCSSQLLVPSSTCPRRTTAAAVRACRRRISVSTSAVPLPSRPAITSRSSGRSAWRRPKASTSRCRFLRRSTVLSASTNGCPPIRSATAAGGAAGGGSAGIVPRCTTSTRAGDSSSCTSAALARDETCTTAPRATDRRSTAAARATSGCTSSGWRRNQQSYTLTRRGQRAGGTT